jgi:hypothetical protein
MQLAMIVIKIIGFYACVFFCIDACDLTSHISKSWE